MEEKQNLFEISSIRQKPVRHDRRRTGVEHSGRPSGVGGWDHRLPALSKARTKKSILNCMEGGQVNCFRVGVTKEVQKDDRETSSRTTRESVNQSSDQLNLMIFGSNDDQHPQRG